MPTKNSKIVLTVAAALAVTAVLTFGTLARPTPRVAVQMPEMIVVTVPAATVGNASQLAGAEAFNYPLD